MILTTELTESLAALIVFCNPPELTLTELLKLSPASFALPPIFEMELPILDAIPPRSCNCDKPSTEVPN